MEDGVKVNSETGVLSIEQVLHQGKGRRKKPVIEPNRIEAERFLKALDPSANSFSFQYYDDMKDRKQGDLYGTLHGPLEEHWGHLVDLNRRGAAITVTVNATDGKGRTENNIARVRAVWQDDDKSHGWTVSIPPSIEVETSQGKHQRYLLIDGTDISTREHASLMDVMVKDHGCDPGAKGINRVLRLPGFFHVKDPTNPQLVRMLPRSGHRYEADAIRKSLPVIPRAAKGKVEAAREALQAQLGVLSNDQLAKIHSAAEFLHNHTNGAEFNERDSWLKWGMALSHETLAGEQGLLVWSELSKKYAPHKFDDRDQQSKWKSFKSDTREPFTLGSIYHRAKGLGWEPPVSQKVSLPRVADADDHSAPPNGSSRDIAARSIKTTTMSDIMPKSVDWLWTNRIAYGKLTMIAGDPGLGKSQLSCYIAARSSRGETFHGEQKKQHNPGTALLISGEDDPADTIWPRLKAAGANLDRVVLVEDVEERDGTGKITKQQFSLQRNLDDLEALIQSLDNVELLIIDPLAAYLGGSDSHKNSEVRAILTPLSKLAAKHNIAVVVIAHLNKSSETKAMYRVSGSLGFVAAARSVYLVTAEEKANPDDGEEDGDPTRRLFVEVKNNLAPKNDGLVFNVTNVVVKDTRTVKEFQTSKIVWSDETTTASANAALNGTGGVEDSRISEAEDFLTQVLGNGERLVSEIKREAEEAGIAWRTIQRATYALDIKRSKRGWDNGWMWRLPKRREWKPLSDEELAVPPSS